MEITAALVKELRERTGSGLMECKRALVEAGGDIEGAVAAMRKAGLVKADKKAGRTAADGAIVLRLGADGRSGVLVEVNCETDFVAKGEDFTAFAAQVADAIARRRPADLAALLALPLDGERSVDTARRELIAKLGENINVRRFATLESAAGIVGGYRHGTRIGVLVELRGGDAELAKDVAMHVAASRPAAVAEQDVPQELLAKEREIFLAQAQESGKPHEIVERMVGGRLKKFLAEVTLVQQPFVKNPDISVAQLLEGAGASVVRFARFEVGEGIEKKDGNFAAEVMAQVRGS